MIGEHVDCGCRTQRIGSLSDISNFISGENTTGGPTLFLSDEDQEANLYSSVFLHKNHPIAFGNFPTFKSRIADPLFSLGHSISENVAFLIADRWPWHQLRIDFEVTHGTLECGSNSLLVSARNPMAHLALLHALTSGEIKSVAFKKDHNGVSLCFTDSGGVILLQPKGVSADNETMHLSFLTTLADHMLIFDGEKTSKEMPVISLEIGEKMGVIRIERTRFTLR